MECSSWSHQETLSKLLFRSNTMPVEGCWFKMGDHDKYARDKPCCSQVLCCGKYAKGKGKGFNHHRCYNHDGTLLLPDQWCVMESAKAVYYNQWHYTDYLVKISKSTDSDSLLMENLFIMFLSLEIVFLPRTCTIIHFALNYPRY